MNNRKPHCDARIIHASRLGQCGVCERQVLLDIKYGTQRTSEQMDLLAAGIETHAHMNRRAQLAYGSVSTSAPDKRCFIASCCLGIDSAETEALRRYRDQVLRESKVGRYFIAFYYRWSPFAVSVLERSDGLRRCAAIFLKRIVRTIDKWDCSQ